nr:glucosaminidase domain-containing protein [Prevotella intermedia]
MRGRKRYSNLFLLSKTDYRGWAHGLKRAGYATNPVYAYSLIDIIELYSFTNTTIWCLERATTTGTCQPNHNRTARMQVCDSSVRFNENCYLTAHAGETYDNIAREIGISARKLAKYNERPEDAPLSEGEIVWLRKKQRHVPKTLASNTIQ